MRSHPRTQENTALFKLFIIFMLCVIAALLIINNIDYLKAITIGE